MEWLRGLRLLFLTGSLGWLSWLGLWTCSLYLLSALALSTCSLHLLSALAPESPSHKKKDPVSSHNRQESRDLLRRVIPHATVTV